MKKSLIVVLLIFSMLLSGCTSCNPFGPGDPDPDGSTIIEPESSEGSEATESKAESQTSQESSKGERDTDRLGGKAGNGVVQGSGGKGESSSKAESSSAAESSKASESSKPAESSKSEESSKAEESSKEESSKSPSGPTDSQAAAYAKAQEYLTNGTGYCEADILDLLENTHGFSHSDSVWGIEQNDPDWNEQAATRGANFLNLGPYSEAMMVDDLMFYGFSEAQAKYGAANCGADWTEQARLYAQYLLNKGTYSYVFLGNKMFEDGFDSVDISTALDEFPTDTWNAEAVEYAISILSEVSYGDGSTWSDFVSKIETVGFSYYEAVYGADNCGYNWNLHAAYNYLNDHITSPKELSDWLYYDLSLTKTEIENILNTLKYDDSGVWTLEAQEYAYYLQGSVITVADMENTLMGLGFDQTTAEWAAMNYGGFTSQENCTYEAQKLVSIASYTRDKLIDVLVSYGYSVDEAKAAADAVGLKGEPKG